MSYLPTKPLSMFSDSEIGVGTWVLIPAYNAGPCYALGRFSAVNDDEVECFVFGAQYVDLEMAAGTVDEARKEIIHFTRQNIRDRKAGLCVNEEIAGFVGEQRAYIEETLRKLKEKTAFFTEILNFFEN